MATPVRTCPKCSKLMWLTPEHMTECDDTTVRVACPNCQATVRISLISRGANAVGPKMGH